LLDGRSASRRGVLKRLLVVGGADGTERFHYESPCRVDFEARRL
jgi:hypothetical protein